MAGETAISNGLIMALGGRVPALPLMFEIVWAQWNFFSMFRMQYYRMSVPANYTSHCGPTTFADDTFYRFGSSTQWALAANSTHAGTISAGGWSAIPSMYLNASNIDLMQKAGRGAIFPNGAGVVQHWVRTVNLNTYIRVDNLVPWRPPEWFPFAEPYPQGHPIVQPRPEAEPVRPRPRQRPSPRPRPRPDPRRDPDFQPLTTPRPTWHSPSFNSRVRGPEWWRDIGPQPTAAPRTLPPPRQFPPGKGQKEKKFKAQGLVNILTRLNPVTEVHDLMECAWKALPPKKRRRILGRKINGVTYMPDGSHRSKTESKWTKGTAHTKALYAQHRKNGKRPHQSFQNMGRDLYNNFKDVNWDEFQDCFLQNEVMDRVIGATSQKSRQVSVNSRALLPSQLWQ